MDEKRREYQIQPRPRYICEQSEHDSYGLINPMYLTNEFAADFRKILAGESESSKPFPHISLPNFLMSMKFLGALRQELDRTRYRRIENDLYSLNQTDDLANYDAAKDFIKTDVLQWLKSVSKIDLNSDVAITGSCYKNTDLLLPHDDQCEGRAIAFVLYLSPNWKEADGGQLVLYETDDQNNPKSIVKSMNPVENTLLLFPVSPRSWHMVTEVTSQKERISLHGWFHSDVCVTAERAKSKSPVVGPKPHMDIAREELRDWLTPEFIDPKYHSDMSTYFCSEGELNLMQFLRVSSNFCSIFLMKKKRNFLGRSLKKHFIYICNARKISNNSIP
ncbi:unnamed protein product [Gongylonema pulchrum]|uniref:Fe2OG dioxygenase domain-containing protein n=1 Tax=Gongylonema pulchrum TaxID=637853 RepID=A0A183DYS9_9BILA|nr:unnamed protein product [Gongylonema pulchrum]